MQQCKIDYSYDDRTNHPAHTTFLHFQEEYLFYSLHFLGFTTLKNVMDRLVVFNQQVILRAAKQHVDMALKHSIFIIMFLDITISSTTIFRKKKKNLPSFADDEW